MSLQASGVASRDFHGSTYVRWISWHDFSADDHVIRTDGSFHA
ncbi:hypothetical protein ACHAXS_006011, partial [Conticribra weissflogii]